MVTACILNEFVWGPETCDLIAPRNGDDAEDGGPLLGCHEVTLLLLVLLLLMILDPKPETPKPLSSHGIHPYIPCMCDNGYMDGPMRGPFSDCPVEA